MNLDLYLAFVVAATVMLLIPGPTIMLVVAYALGHGKRTALATVLGVGLGDAVALTVSLLGLGALLAPVVGPSRLALKVAGSGLKLSVKAAAAVAGS